MGLSDFFCFALDSIMGGGGVLSVFSVNIMRGISVGFGGVALNFDITIT